MAEERKLYDDEMKVKMISAMGLKYGEMVMPRRMREHLIKAYFDSKTVESAYLFIDDKEVTDGKNYNPFRGQLEEL